jgi:plasmid maintenance system antidote protein VapI
MTHEAHEHPLRIWRKSRPKPLTQGAIGEKLGIGASQVSQIESWSRGCSLDMALKIHKLTGGFVPLESLLGTRTEAAE